MNASEPLLEIKNLYVNYKVFGGELQVLNGLNLKVFPGERVGLVGETGCGKTTSMKTVLGVLPIPPGKVVSGEILYQGRNLLGMSSAKLSNVRGREMTMIFQDPMAALNPVFNIEQQFSPVLQHAAKKRPIEQRNSCPWCKRIKRSCTG